MKKILFLSGLDFKDKSIQVIRKTPEAYVNSGWNVHYIVARDTSSKGNYYYEQIIDMLGMTVDRFNWPFPRLRATESRFLSLFFSKIASFFVVSKLFLKAFVFLIKNKDCKYIYGYEVQGVLATNLLKLFFVFRENKYISRFQGVFYIKEHLKNKRILSLIFNIDTIIALWLPTDLMVMTNDGTQGDLVLDKLNSRARKNLLFISNGVDVNVDNILNFSSSAISKKSNVDMGRFDFLMVSRLVKIKRVDLAIEAYQKYLNSGGVAYFNLTIVGDGPELESLKQLASQYGLKDRVVFIGAVVNKDVYKLMCSSSLLISLYESSNIGNPFFESMACSLPFVAVNNGDTSRFVTDRYNGILISEESIVDDLVAFFKEVYSGRIDLNVISKNCKKYANENILSWSERMQVEIDKVVSL